MRKKTVAILGATSHIAKGLIYHFLQSNEYHLHLFARKTDRIDAFLKKNRLPNKAICNVERDFQKLNDQIFDVVINCVGVGTFIRLKGRHYRFFTITEQFDNLAIEYLRRKNPQAVYISFSSGAVYGRRMAEPAHQNSVNEVRVNHILPEDYYGIARINAEAKHRAFPELQIIDLRVFSYFSRFIDLSDGYFITDVINSIRNDTELVTDSSNMTRDYIHPYDLYSIVCSAMASQELNSAADIYSSKSVSKSEILDYFSNQYGLNYQVTELVAESATGAKPVYATNYRNAAVFNHTPRYSSMEAISMEAAYLLNNA